MNIYLKHYSALIILSLSFVSCHIDKDDSELINSDTKWWILTRPDNNNIGDSGIFLYNETKSTIEKKIDLPITMDSPHALEFDGKFLWLGGMGPNESIYKLNPNDGTIISEFKNIRTAGMAYLNGDLYYSIYGMIYQINEDGTPIKVRSISIGLANPADIAITNSELYYVYNGSIDPIIRVDLTSSFEEKVVETEVISLNTLTIYEEEFIVITDSNQIRRFNMNTGEKVSDTESIIEGWITAIVPYTR